MKSHQSQERKLKSWLYTTEDPNIKRPTQVLQEDTTSSSHVNNNNNSISNDSKTIAPHPQTSPTGAIIIGSWEIRRGNAYTPAATQKTR